MNSTIVAQSTAQGSAAIAVIRLTGNLCKQLYKECFKRTNHKSYFRRAHFGTYVSLDNELLDEVVYILFNQGASYTGEYMLEISCHGNPLIVERIIRDLLRRGCELASPGEFTQRAFLNNKIDLTQAEAVCDLIKASSDQALKVARRQLDGALKDVILSLTKQWVHVIALLEAYIDFPEEDLPAEDTGGPLKELADLRCQLEFLLKSRASKAALFENPQVVIVGPPNAGKSSLFNRLLGFDRSIVSDVEGTTRDYVKERIGLDGFCIDIVDTAGIRDCVSGIEFEGIGLSKKKMKDADLCLLVVDASKEASLLRDEAFASLQKERTIIVESKSDLGRHPSYDCFLDEFRKCSVSSDTGDGMELLCIYISDTLKKETLCPDGVMISARHEAVIETVRQKLDCAIGDLKSKEPIEFVISELREGLDIFGQIVGRVDNEAILDQIFATFCIGK